MLRAYGNSQGTNTPLVKRDRESRLKASNRGKKMGNIEKLTNGPTGGPVFVYVQDGRIIRITPMEFDDDDAPSWNIDARGRVFSPPRKTTLSPYSFAWRSMVYSPTRLLHPLKRVDFDPNGQRNCTKRGESGYERISWDEAGDIVAGEIQRIKREYLGAYGLPP